MLTFELPSLLQDQFSFTDNANATIGLATASVQSPSGGNINLGISNGGIIGTPTTSQPQGNPPLQPNQTLIFPHQLLSFQTITDPNGIITLTIQYPSLPPLASNQSYAYYKFNTNTNSWREVHQGTGVNQFSISGTTVTLRIQDNGPLDFNPTPGIVADPGGLAIITTTQPPAGGGGGGAGGGGGGGTIVISKQRSTIATQLAMQTLPRDISIEKILSIAGSLTDDKGNSLQLNGTITIIAEANRITRTYTAELKQGVFSINIDAARLLKDFKSRTIDITIKFDGFEVQDRQRIVEYKGAELKHTIKIVGEDIMKGVKQLKRAGASLIKLDNFTDKSIAKIVLKAEGDDAKIIYSKGKDMSRMRMSMQEVMLEVKEGKSIGFGDTVRMLVYARGIVTYTVYDMQGNVIAEGRI
ncbi:hypothetical protein HRbin04_01346 [archaeon HR04]|nr:hypothetical protein HRbin04_01346 [archaeon HR04]